MGPGDSRCFTFLQEVLSESPSLKTDEALDYSARPTPTMTRTFGAWTSVAAAAQLRDASWAGISTDPRCMWWALGCERQRVATNEIDNSCTACDDLRVAAAEHGKTFLVLLGSGSFTAPGRVPDQAF